MKKTNSSLEIKQHHTQFAAMVGAYFFGVFNDNYFKQAAMLLAVTAGLSHLQGTATILFSLPFILFSAYGGWLADRYPKKAVVISTKILELFACVIGAIGLYFMNWNCILAMIFMMGVQATFLTPALNATIPEIYPENLITKANALLKLMTTLAILFGIASAGISLDQKWQESTVAFGLILTAAIVILVSVFGLTCSFFIPNSPRKNPTLPFPLKGPWQSLIDLYKLKSRPDLLTSLLSSTFFYSISTLVVLIINTLALKQFGLSQTVTSLLSVSLMLGICAGAFIAGKISSPTNWFHLLPLSASVMSVGLGALGLSALIPETIRLSFLFFMLIIIGTAGGILIIPVTTYIQVKPSHDEKGKIIGLVNFSDFIGIVFAGEFYLLLDHFLSPSHSMLVLALLAFLYAVITSKVIKGLRFIEHASKS